MWGAMCEKNKKISVCVNDIDTEIPDDAKILSIKKFEDCYKVKYVPNNRVFRTDYARIGPFLTSYARWKMSEFMNKQLDITKVRRVCVDGCILEDFDTSELTCIGQNISDYKIDATGKCKIINSMVVNWLD